MSVARGMSPVRSRIITFDARLKSERDYWLKKLSREIGPSNLRPDFERPATYAAEKNRVAVSVSEALCQKLDKLTKGSDFLLYAALHAALKVCLHKYTASNYIAIGSPARLKEQASNMPGNALAIVDELDADDSFRELLLRVRETLLEAYERQDYPFERVVRDLGEDLTEADKCPLFDIALILEDLHGGDRLPAVKNDITISFRKSSRHLEGHIEYDTRLFRRETIERFYGHFTALLAAALDNPQALVGSLEMVTPEERRRVLFDWNKTATADPQDQCIHQLFAAQVAASPDAVALSDGRETMTYAELHRRSNQLARYLRGRGVGADVPVCISVERGFEMVVGLLGILKAGGAYVPLDPSYPNERLSYMLEQTGATLLLTQQRLVKKLPQSGAQVIRLDADWDLIACESEGDVAADVTADNLAYVIYTSGSTGKPKGVMVPHRGVCNLARSQVRAFGVRPERRVLQFASFSFDASVSEVFMALTCGATLCFASDGGGLSGLDLLKVLREQGITTVTLPPAMMGILTPENLPALQTVIAAGERCPAEVMQRWSKGRRFFNAYGPTETSVCASIHECGSGETEAPPIGRPMANMETYLLDARLQPVPLGVCGELYVGGAGLARGYHGQPALTAERFIPHPFSSEPGARLYRTGDLARYLEGGELEYLGRVDNQVKVRGFRIELGEVEAAVCGHEGVRQCAAIVREDVAGDKRLVAYVVLKEGAQASLTADELRSFVALKLPDYMVPSTLMFLPELPLSINGKIDRRRLPAPETGARADGARFVAPRTLLEEAVCGIWAEVLRVERVGVEDNFFELGGHSLLATQVISRVREAFTVELPIGTLFERPTAAGMCEAIERARKSDAEQPRVVTAARAISPVARRLQRVQISQGVLTTERKKN